MISELMTKDFKSAAPNELAYNIMKYMKEFKITELPVIENGELLGLISVHKIIEEGIV
jgi:signal-transduction protein with cAMP-binding, CBS, and nucleotidyltransferase domain